MLERHFEAVAHHVPARLAVSADRRLLDRRLLHSRVLGRSRRALQSVDRAGARSERPAERREALRDELARRRRRPFVVDRVPLGRARRRRRASRSTMPGRIWSRAAGRRRATSTSALQPPSCRSSVRSTSCRPGCWIGSANKFTLEELEASLSIARSGHGPPPAIWFETVEDHSRAGVVELRDHFPGGLEARRARHLSGRPERNPRHGRRSFRARSPMTTAAPSTTPPTPLTTASRSCRS